MIISSLPQNHLTLENFNTLTSCNQNEQSDDIYPQM